MDPLDQIPPRTIPRLGEPFPDDNTMSEIPSEDLELPQHLATAINELNRRRRDFDNATDDLWDQVFGKEFPLRIKLAERRVELNGAWDAFVESLATCLAREVPCGFTKE